MGETVTSGHMRDNAMINEGWMLAQVANVISKPENDDLSLVEASRCAPPRQLQSR
jgi:hypothetical protein